MSKTRTPEQVAAILAKRMYEVGANRSRISLKTLALLAGFPRLRAPFIDSVQRAIQDYEILMGERITGGFVFTRVSALTGAPILLLDKETIQRLETAPVPPELSKSLEDFE